MTRLDTTDLESAAPLPLLKVLGDDTRYAIYVELTRSSEPRSIDQISTSVGLHPNTVRPQLERMREVGLVEVTSDSGGAGRRVGRPRHRYSLADGAPAISLEPTVLPTLARMVLSLAERLGASAADAEAVGRAEGRSRSEAFAHRCVSTGDALVDDQLRLGFGPTAVSGSSGTVVTFGRCPFGGLAEQHPELVCGLHRGLIDGFVDGSGDGSGETELADFQPRSDRAPCRATLR